MKKCLILAMLIIFPLAMLIPDHADARRFGGGFSFGKQRMHRPAPKHFSQRSKTPGKSAASRSQRGSARTGMMGMLGGLALGGLLGTMFFGGGFEGINSFDILVIGGLIFLILWFLRRKAQPGRMTYAGQQTAAQEYSGNGYTEDAQASQVTMLRPKINEKHFLNAARDIFMRMQTAWDAKDIEDIRRFCTADVADKIAADMLNDGSDKTDVTTLNAELADSWIESDLEWAAVRFNAMLQEQSLGANGKSIETSNTDMHEIWIFRHDPTADDPTWYLAGIQQDA